MKNRRERTKQVWRRKVAILAAYSKGHSVKNCTIPKVDEKDLIEKKVKWGVIQAVKDNAEWNIPEEGYPQPKSIHKKYKKIYYCKDSKSVRKIISHPSDYTQFPDHTFHPKGRTWYMEQAIQYKLAKWEKKNPCPVKKDQNPPDIFEQEYLIPWKAKRDLALEHIRDFIVSVYDKLPLTGRFQKSDNDFVEKEITEIKDTKSEGNEINNLNPKTSPLLKKAQKETNKVKAKHTNLVCTNLKDHKRQKGRIILPKAA